MRFTHNLRGETEHGRDAFARRTRYAGKTVAMRRQYGCGMMSLMKYNKDSIYDVMHRIE